MALLGSAGGKVGHFGICGPCPPLAAIGAPPSTVGHKKKILCYNYYYYNECANCNFNEIQEIQEKKRGNRIILVVHARFGDGQCSLVAE